MPADHRLSLQARHAPAFLPVAESPQIRGFVITEHVFRSRCQLLSFARQQIAYHLRQEFSEFDLHHQFSRLKNLPCQTFLLRFLLEGRAAEPSGGYKTFREMPWGEMYIGPYTGRVLTRAAFTFGTRVEKFRAACEAMGALAIPHGDAGFQFDFLGGYRMQIMVYAGDEEFPPSSQVLYSDNFETGFAAEDRVVAGDILISAIKANL